MRKRDKQIALIDNSSRPISELDHMTGYALFGENTPLKRPAQCQSQIPNFA